jgi:transposase
MNKISKPARRMETTRNKPEMTMGIDVGDRFSHLCLVDNEGEVVERDRVRSTEAAFRRYFEGMARLRIALECGTHSPWMSRLLKQLGHQVIVANARKIPTITESESKNDDRDAEQLALMAAFNPKLLSPLEHRSVARQQDLNLIQARAILVKARTMIVNALRGLVKSAGGRGLRAHPRPARCSCQQSLRGSLPRPASRPKPVRRLGSAEAHHPNRQYLSALSAGTVGAIRLGALRSRFGLAPLGPEAGRQRRQASQEASHRRRGPQTGCYPAQHVAQRPALRALSTTGSGAGMRRQPNRNLSTNRQPDVKAENRQ